MISTRLPRLACCLLGGVQLQTDNGPADGTLAIGEIDKILHETSRATRFTRGHMTARWHHLGKTHGITNRRVMFASVSLLTTPQSLHQVK